MKALIVIGVIFVIAVILSIVNYRRMRKIARGRGEANICAYARSFDYRSVDTKIIREVWNELQSYLGKYDGKLFPLQANDMFEETYKLDPHELDDVYWAVADRLGIETENPESNPYWNKITSVKSLVLFLDNQPRKKSFKTYPSSVMRR